MRHALAAAVLLLAGCRGSQQDRTVDVYAAASLTDVLEALADTFHTRDPNGHRIRLNVAGSSLLARQISQGAGADLFVSAHPSWTELLRLEGRLVDVDTLPIANELVLVSRGTGGWSSGRIALADPEHVPAGIYAREALQCQGIWPEIEDRLVPTLDVRAALMAVTEGAASSAVVYASDTLYAPGLTLTRFVSDACHPDIRYTAGVTNLGNEGAARFLSMLTDSSLAPLWHQFGFRTARSLN